MRFAFRVGLDSFTQWNSDFGKPNNIIRLSQTEKRTIASQISAVKSEHTITNQLEDAPFGYPTKNYHRRLIEVAVAAVILGVVFLIFWQSVLQSAMGPATWDEQYCRRLLGQYEPELATGLLSAQRANGTFRLAGVFSDGKKLVEIRGIGETVETCGITVVSDSPVGSGFGNEYDCPLSTVRYVFDERTDWKMAGVQIELIPDVLGIGGQGRYTTIITYYNPTSSAALAAFDATKNVVNNKLCDL